MKSPSTAGLPSTTAQALDAVATEVLALAKQTPRRSHPDLADAIFAQFAIRVTPENLRMWLARRYADEFRADVAPAIRSVLDDYVDVVNELRDPALNAGAYTWEQVLDCLKRLDPTLTISAEGLRSWYSRRCRRGAKAAAAASHARLAGSPVAAEAIVATSNPPAAAPMPKAPGQAGAAHGQDLKARARDELQARQAAGNPLAAALAAAGVGGKAP